MKMIKAFLQGLLEFRSSFTQYHDDLLEAHYYDVGREFAHRLTLRQFD